MNDERSGLVSPGWLPVKLRERRGLAVRLAEESVWDGEAERRLEKSSLTLGRERDLECDGSTISLQKQTAKATTTPGQNGHFLFSLPSLPLSSVLLSSLFGWSIYSSQRDNG
jgi:hypothetical protein